MGRECIEKGEISTPLVAKDEHHQIYGSGTSSGDHVCANTTSCDGGGEMVVVRVRVDLPQPQVWLCLSLWLLSHLCHRILV